MIVIQEFIELDAVVLLFGQTSTEKAPRLRISAFLRME